MNFPDDLILWTSRASVSELSVQFGLISTCISTILSFGSGKHLLVNYLYSLGSSVHVSPPFCPLGSTCL